MPLDATPGQQAAGDGTASPPDQARGETRVDLKTPITDDRSAAAALEGLLDFGDGTSGDDASDTAQSDASASDAAPGESPASGDEEGQSEAQGQSPAPIVAPNSWSDEDKAVFGKLPPEAQKVIARRESERDKAFTQRTQEIADERKGWETERTAMQGQRQQYQTSLQQLLHLALPEAQAFANVEWTKLSTENPAEYVRLSAARDQLRGRVQTLHAEQQRVQGEILAEQQKRAQSFLGEQRRLLAEKIPDFADAEKGKKLAQDLSAWLGNQGFTAQEVGQVADHRLVSLALRAMRADQADAARKAAEGKRNNTPPNVQRPGSPQGSDDTAARRAQGKVQQFGRTNSVRDAASLLMEIL